MEAYSSKSRGSMSVSGVGQGYGAQYSAAPSPASPYAVPGVPPEIYSGILYGPPIPQQPPQVTAMPSGIMPAPRGAATPQQAQVQKRRHRHMLYAILGGVGIIAAGALLFFTMRRGGAAHTTLRPNEQTQPATRANARNENKPAQRQAPARSGKSVSDDDDDVDIPHTEDHHGDDNVIDEFEEEEHEEDDGM